MNRPRELPFKLFEALRLSDESERSGIDVILTRSKRAVFNKYILINDITPTIEELEQYKETLYTNLNISNEAEFVILLLEHQINLMKEVFKNGKKDNEKDNK